MSENNTENIIKEKRKNKLGAGPPIKYENGCKENQKITKYHQQYYHKTNKCINCEFCGKQSTLRSIKTHHMSMKCSFIRLKKEIKTNDDIEIII